MELTFFIYGDRTRPHQANLVDEFLESKHIERIPWPGKSADLNLVQTYGTTLKNQLLGDFRLLEM